MPILYHLYSLFLSVLIFSVFHYFFSVDCDYGCYKKLYDILTTRLPVTFQWFYNEYLKK